MTDALKYKHPLVLIEWLDSARPVGAWIWLSDFEAPEALSCQSVGWLLHDGEVKALAPNIGDVGGEDEQACGIIRIPACAIIKMMVLREASDATS